MNPLRVRVYIMLLATAIIWGIAGPVIKFTLGGLSPEIFLTYRFAISTIVGLTLLSLSRFRGIPRNPKTLLWLLVYAVLTSTVALGILFLGYKETSAIDAGLIGATAPLFVALGGVIFLKEHMTKREKFGLSIAFLGTIITVVEPIFKNHNGSAGVIGNLLVFVSVLVGVASAVIAKQLLRNGVVPAAMAHVTFIIGFATILPITLLSNSSTAIIETVKNTPLAFHLGVIYMALLSGNLAYYMWTKAEKTIEIGEVGYFAYLYPVFGTPVAVVWLGEKITVPFIMGAIVIAIGVGVAGYKRSLPLRGKKTGVDSLDH